MPVLDAVLFPHRMVKRLAGARGENYRQNAPMTFLILSFHCVFPLAFLAYYPLFLRTFSLFPRGKVGVKVRQNEK